MKEDIHKKIWDLALEFQDVRNDEGHAETVVFYSRKLLILRPEADQDVVIDAATLHDIGWSQMPVEESEYKKHIVPEEDKIRRLKHEEIGVEKAKEILDKVPYEGAKAEHVLRIIKGHDTRKETISLEDAIVRDSDKLWRFSNKGFWIAIRNLGMSPEQEYTKLEGQINEKGFFFTEKAREIAREELEQRKKEAANWGR